MPLTLIERRDTTEILKHTDRKGQLLGYMAKSKEQGVFERKATLAEMRTSLGWLIEHKPKLTKSKADCAAELARSKK